MDLVEIILYVLMFAAMLIPLWLALALAFGIYRDAINRAESFRALEEDSAERRSRIASVELGRRVKI